MNRLLTSTLLCLSLLTVTPLAVASEATTEVPKSLLQQIRELLGLVQPVAAGGSRGSRTQVCLISPRLVPRSDTAVVSVPSPTIITSEPVNELRLERDGQLLWRSVASSTAPVAARTPWPIAPLQPGSTVELVVRPRGASGGDLARIKLKVAAQDVLQANAAVIKKLSLNPQAWPSAFQSALAKGDQSLAVALLSSDVIPIDQKAQIQQTIQEASCK